MKIQDTMTERYENTKLIRFDDEKSPVFNHDIAFEDLPYKFVPGVLKSNRYVNGKLMQTYTLSEANTCVISATRQGKTTSAVIPQIISFSVQKKKRSMIISDPKGELYRLLGASLKDNGYTVKVVNMRDYMHSECWNPLLPIYRDYQKAHDLEAEVELVQTKNGLRNKFMGVIYNNQKKLDKAVGRVKRVLLGEVEGKIGKLMISLVPTKNTHEPYWEDAARQFGKAIIYAMLEDSLPNRDVEAEINEDTFSFSTLLSIVNSLTPSNDYNDNNFFSKRGTRSKAYKHAKSIIENSAGTRQCIVSTFLTQLQIFQDSAIRMLTGCESFKMEQLTQNKPISVFIIYPDESKEYYDLISMFIEQSFKHLTSYATEKENGKLDVPFYFILDECANFCNIPDMGVKISTCGGRNIWFYMVLQSYAQLENLYGAEVSTIIRDNMNCRIFFGSNNPSTLEAFSQECGKTTRLSPRSALNGQENEITYFDFETLPTVPKSRLACLNEGECVVTEINCGYVLFSKMERYYKIQEFNGLKKSYEKNYKARINPLDAKYNYEAFYEDE